MNTTKQQSEMFIVHQFISGSNEINRMRVEIKLFISTIISLLNFPEETDVDLTNRKVNQIQAHPYWVFEYKHFRVCKERFSVRYYNYFEDGSLVALAFCYDHDGVSLHFSNVKIIYEALPVLYTLLIENFPNLRNSMRPFLEASKIQ